MNNKILIVAHGDLDGITSAALLAEELRIESENINVIFTQPFLVDKVVIPEEVEKVYVVDIAINNRDEQMTKKFIRYLGKKLVIWYDHHKGWSECNRYGKRSADIIINSDALACASLVGIENRYDIRINNDDIRVKDAIVADTREGELSPTGQLIDRAIKSDMSNDIIRMWAVKLLMGAEEYRKPLEGAARAYGLIENETYRLSKQFVDLDCGGTFVYPPIDNKLGNIAYVDATESTHQYDLTQLLLAGQVLADFAIVKTVSHNTGEAMLTIATKSKTNLVELFGLTSGAPFRVTLPANRWEEICGKLGVVN